MTKLLASPEDLKTVLLGHVSSGSYPVALIRSGDLPSLNGVSNKIALSETGLLMWKRVNKSLKLFESKLKSITFFKK